jgi:hypothetical protein
MRLRFRKRDILPIPDGVTLRRRRSRSLSLTRWLNRTIGKAIYERVEWDLPGSLALYRWTRRWFLRPKPTRRARLATRTAVEIEITVFHIANT